MVYTAGAAWVGPAVKAGLAGYAAYSAMRGNRTRGADGDAVDGIGATTLSRRRYRIGRRQRRTARKVFNTLVGGGQQVVWRWQQISDSILGPGRLPMGWSQGGSAVTEWIPFHFMSLTQCGDGVSNSLKGCYTDGIKRVYFDSSASNSNFTWVNTPAQIYTGATGAGVGWQNESTVGNYEGGRSRYHSWTDIRLNLYGTRAVPVTYSIYIIQCPKNYDLQEAGIHFEGSDQYNMLKAITRASLGNSLNMNGRVDWPKDVRIVRKYVHTIQPLSYSDQAANPATGNVTGHIKECKIFMRHDRQRNYNWSEFRADTAYDNGLTTLGWDYNIATDGSAVSDVEWGKRLYLFITATSPKKDPVEHNGYTDQDSAWNIFQGSYDIIVRNKFVNL